MYIIYIYIYLKITCGIICAIKNLLFFIGKTYSIDNYEMFLTCLTTY